MELNKKHSFFSRLFNIHDWIYEMDMSAWTKLEMARGWKVSKKPGTPAVKRTCTICNKIEGTWK